MCKSRWWVGLSVALGLGLPGMVVGEEPDPEEVRRLMQQYEREAVPKPVAKPQPKPASKPQPKPASKPVLAMDHDREAWKSAEKCGTAACFEAYLEDYPKGRYAKMARARLNSEPVPQTPATTTEVEEQPRQTTDTREGNAAVWALLDSADRHVKSGRLDVAGAALERALRIEPRNAGIWHDLAQIRLHQGQYQAAESLAAKSNHLSGGNGRLQSRNWKLIAAARKAVGNIAGVAEAEAQAAILSR